MEYCYHDSYKAMKAKCILGKSLWVIVLAYLTVMRNYKVSLGAVLSQVCAAVKAVLMSFKIRCMTVADWSEFVPALGCLVPRG